MAELLEEEQDGQEGKESARPELGPDARPRRARCKTTDRSIPSILGEGELVGVRASRAHQMVSSPGITQKYSRL